MHKQTTPQNADNAAADPFKDCVLTKMARAGIHLDYSYPSSGLPPLRGNPRRPAKSLFIEALKAQHGDWTK